MFAKVFTYIFSEYVILLTCCSIIILFNKMLPKLSLLSLCKCCMIISDSNQEFLNKYFCSDLDLR